MTQTPESCGDATVYVVLRPAYTANRSVLGSAPSIASSRSAGCPSSSVNEVSASRIALDRGEHVVKLDFSTADAIRMATIDGARTLGLEDKIGSLTPGKRADILVVRPAYAELAIPNSLDAAIAVTDPSHIEHVFVDGRPLKLNGELLGHDLAEIRKRARVSRERLSAPSVVAQ